jgi:hypothetical protein
MLLEKVADATEESARVAFSMMLKTYELITDAESAGVNASVIKDAKEAEVVLESAAESASMIDIEYKGFPSVAKGAWAYPAYPNISSR